MILVRRATSVSELQALLNKIRGDVADPLILVDKQGTDREDPQYTVVWQQGDIDPDT